MANKLRGLFLAVTIGLVVTLVVVPSSAQELFYRDKTIRVIVATGAGGGFDTYARTIARHMGKHIPGSPTIIVENMPGAGHLIGANHVYKVAKPDGLTLGNFIGTLLLGQLLGRPGVEFDARRFEWIGVPVSDTDTCALTKASGITSLEKWREAKTPVKLGGVGTGDSTDTTTNILKASLKLPIQLVSGYKGTAAIRLAAEGGEIAGMCGIAWESLKVTWRKALDAGDAVVVLQTTPKAHPDLPNVPLAMELAKTDEARHLIQAGVHDMSAIMRPYMLPPGTPKERVQILREAFQETLKDPEFVADAKKSQLDIRPLAGEEMEKIVNGLFKLDPATVARLKEILLTK